MVSMTKFAHFHFLKAMIRKVELFQFFYLCLKNLKVAYFDHFWQLSPDCFSHLLYLPFLFFKPCTTSAIQKLFTTSVNAFLGGCKVIIPFLENLIQPILDSHTSELNKNAVNTKYQWDVTFCYTFLLQLGKY